MQRRSQLYVPGNNEKMIAKSATLDSDSVILDLEDAVPPSEKLVARRLVCGMAGELDWGGKELCVRVNPPGSREFRDDVAAMKKVRRIQTLLIPKAGGRMPQPVSSSGKAIIPIIETAAGFLALGEIAAGNGVVALTYGAADYAASVGGSVSAYLRNGPIKTMIAAVARSRALEAIDNVFFDLDDAAGFRAEAVEARALGFTGKQVIHPAQIPVANEIFSPTEDELEWARKVTEEMRSAGARKVGAIRVDGKLVDAVHYRMAKDILERGSAGTGA